MDLDLLVLRRALLERRGVLSRIRRDLLLDLRVRVLAHNDAFLVVERLRREALLGISLVSF